MLKDVLLLAACLLVPVSTHAAWSPDWSSQQKISINTQAVEPALSEFPVVVRLHSGNFDFTNAKIDGSDLRFIAADDKSELKYHIEKFDAVNELAVLWVQLPKVDAADKSAHFWLYAGNDKATASSDPKTTWDANTTAVFHFAEKALFQDSAATALVASGEISVQKAGLIGESAMFNGNPFVIPANPAISRAAGAGYTWSAWVKPASLDQPATLYAQGDALTLRIDGQKLSLNVAGSNISGGEIKAASWQHIAFTLEGGKANIFLNGVAVASGEAPVMEVATDIKIGAGYLGEMDELEIAKVARSEGWLKLIASAQGMDSQLLKVEEPAAGEGEEEGETNYIGILLDSLTVDAKVVIGILAVMFAISAYVMLQKARLVSRTDQDNRKFMARFHHATNDNLLALDKDAHFPHASLYKIYSAGLREIRKREIDGQPLALSGAAMDAIKASIDADLVRETQRQNAGMVLLTIAISGGPFLGLLGTVVGVMITFAAIAAAGDVNVNAIAPGIAAALLATVAGLAVAIPALFGYNYLASRIKNISIAMQIFVDEFITRVAELHGRD